MHFIRQNTNSGACVLALLFGFTTLVSCGSFWKKDEDKKPLARVGNTYLYKEDIKSMLGGEMSAEDSASFVSNYINNWAAKQLLLSKARINLPEEQLAEFDNLVANYRTDLYTRAYKEALVAQREDTTISRSQLEAFYEREKENFKLKEKLVMLRYVELPPQFMDKDEVVTRLRRFSESDMEYLDSISVQFKKLHFNDSLWVPVSRVMEEIPPINFENEDRYLKKSQFFELEDSMGVYLGRVNDVLKINDIAPLSYIEPSIRQVLINRRKLDYLKKLDMEIMDEATRNKEFEVYE